MNQSSRLPRSPELMSRTDSGLLVVDVQEKLVPLMIQAERLVWNIGRLVDGARILSVPVAGTEQYPRGLGATVSPLAQRLGQLPEKLTFSCGGCPQVFEAWRDAGIGKILVAGIEAHVCVQQSVLDLLSDGFRVYLAVDAIASRQQRDYDVALRRMDSAGATLTTTEAALLEWCDVAGTPEFKKISALVREAEPAHPT